MLETVLELTPFTYSAISNEYSLDSAFNYDSMTYLAAPSPQQSSFANTRKAVLFSGWISSYAKYASYNLK